MIFCWYLFDLHDSLGFRNNKLNLSLSACQPLATACLNCQSVIVVGGLDVVARAWLKQSCAYFSVVYEYSRSSVSFCSQDWPTCRDVMVWRIGRREERQREAAECLRGDAKLRINKCHICFVIISSSRKVRAPNKLLLSSYRCTIRSCSPGN